MMKENKNNRIVAYFSTSSSTSGRHLPSLFDTTTDVDSKVSSSQQKRRKNKTRRKQRCSKVFEIIKRLIVYAIALTAITSSVVSIFSCNFFSYTDIAVATDDVDGFTSALENDNDNEDSIVDLGYQYTPFEFMNEGGVGLFAYYMGDPSEEGSILYKQEPMCFLYCDELHDFYWFYNNYNPGKKGLLSRKIDLWIVARYCSIIAPIMALLGLLQLIVVENWFCGYGINLVTNETAKVASSFFLFLTFLSASMIQWGTFSIMFASPNLSSPSQSDGTTYQDSFCFSTTTSSNNYVCQLDTGAFYSLGSGLVYLVLAVYSSLSTYSRTTTTSATTPIPSATTDDENNNNESADHNSTRSLCCGGCCLRRDSDSKSKSSSGISNNNNNNEDQKVVSSNRGLVVAADSEEKSETSDSSNNSSSSNSTSTSKLLSKLSYQEEEEHDDEEEQHDATDADKEDDDGRSRGTSFSFFGSEITF